MMPYLPFIITAISTAVSAALTGLFHRLAPAFIKLPSRHVLIEDKREKYIAYRRYLAIYTSIAHGIMCVIFSSYILCLDGITYDEPNKRYHYILMGLSLGYYIVDSIAGFKYAFDSLTMRCHHLVMIVLLSYVIIKQRYGGIFTFFIFIGELSNPCMHIRKNLMQFNNTKAYTDFLGIIFCITFLICRIFGVLLVVKNIRQSTISLAFMTALTTLWYISLEFCFTVGQFFSKGLGELGIKPCVRVYELLKSINEDRFKSILKHIFLIGSTYGCLIGTHPKNLF